MYRAVTSHLWFDLYLASATDFFPLTSRFYDLFIKIVGIVTRHSLIGCRIKSTRQDEAKSYHFLCRLAGASPVVWLALRGDGEGLRGQEGLPGAKPPDPTVAAAVRRALEGARHASAVAVEAGPAFVAANKQTNKKLKYHIFNFLWSCQAFKCTLNGYNERLIIS